MKARRASGRSLLPGLINSMAATRVAPVTVAKTWTSTSSGKTVGTTRSVAGGAHAGRGWGSATGFDEIATPFGDVTAQTVRGTFGGAQLGYNHQFGRVVSAMAVSRAPDRPP